MLKLSTSLLALVSATQASTCITCEHIGFAATEEDAINTLAETAALTGDNFCISGGDEGQSDWGAVTASYCVAQFFVYKAKDVAAESSNDKKPFVYGVRRFGSDANVNPGLIDAAGYDGIKAFQISAKSDATTGFASAGSTLDGGGAYVAPATGPNPKFPQRGSASCNQEDPPTANTNCFMGDGREDKAETSSTTLSIVPVQETSYTRCLICHGTQEFRSPPLVSSEVTDNCWNPSGSTAYDTDLDATLDPLKYCKPTNGFCSTTTWQYSTYDDAGATSSHWIGIERGCATDAVAPVTALSHTTKRGATGMQERVRWYAATNTASKAKDNAKYPDADVSANKQIKSDGTLAPITAQFMSPDGSGKPDVETTVRVAELECLSCVTPIGNTDSTNTCVNAKTTGRVKCKTLSCASVTANYLLGDSSDKYYYAKRGCDVDPEDGKPDGEQDPADLAVVPAGWTDIKQYNQRTTTKNGNTGRSSSTSVAKIFDCYSCESSFSATVEGPNPVEPLYDSIKTKDTSLCWETYEPQTDTSVSSTGSSGSCVGNCYTSAYKFKETSGPVSNPTTVFNWYVKRGCQEDKTSVKSGTTPSKDLFGVTVTNSVCTFQNGTLCNGKIESYDTSLQLKTQNVRKLQCFTCETPSGNTDAADECYTVPSTAKATECDDLSFVSCYATQTSFVKDGVAQYGMVRGCAKTAAASSTVAVEGYSNVNAVTTGCASSSCNKVAGKTEELVEAVGSGARPDVSGAEEEADDAVVEDAEAGAASFVASLTMLVLALVN